MSIVLWVALTAAPAAACDFLGPTPLEPVASEDVTAPAAPAFEAPEVQRGTGPRGFIAQSSTSCDDLGWITVAVALFDDTSPEDAIGIEVIDVAGTLPDGLTLPDGPWVHPDGVLQWTWGDEAVDSQEAFAFTATLVAVDEAGNRSAEVPLDVEDPGHGGCDHRGPGGSVGVGILGALVTRWRARGRRQRRLSDQS